VTRPGGSPTPTTSQLTDPAAIAAAREWLTDAGIMPANADAGRVTRPTTGQVWVTFHPQPPGNLIPQDPMIQVKLGLDGAVREVYHRWPTNLVPREVTVRELSAAWSEVAAGGGYLEVDQTIPQDLPANTVFTGNAVVARVAIGWAPGTDGKTNYLLHSTSLRGPSPSPTAQGTAGVGAVPSLHRRDSPLTARQRALDR
jgi:hypothetical protein